MDNSRVLPPKPVHDHAMAQSLEIRQPHIFKSPNELLMKVFSFVREDSLKDLQSSRLVCRRFASTATPFLMKSVGVGLTLSSIAWLQDVSRHPAISTSIDTIQVSLSFYDIALADMLVMFASHHGKRLSRMKWSVHSTLHKYRALCDPEFKKAKKIITICSSGIRACNDLAMDEDDDSVGRDDDSFGRDDDSVGKDAQWLPEDDAVRALILRAHSVYRQRFREQEHLREGKFMKEVTSAVKRMPNTARLVVCDKVRLRDEDRTRSEHFKDIEGLYRHLLLPTGWELGFDSPMFQELFPLIFTIPIALDDIGVQMKSLKLHDLNLADVKIPNLRKEEISALTKAVTRLETLEFLTSDFGTSQASRLRGNRSSREIEAIMEIITALTDTTVLQSLDMWFADKLSLPVPMGNIMSSHTWPNLKELDLEGVTLSYSNLENVFDHLTGQMTYFGLSQAHLADGYWTDVLGMLRHHKVTAVYLDGLMGAECLYMDQDDDDRILFEDYFPRYRGVNLVERYAMGLVDHNPLKGYYDAAVA